MTHDALKAVVEESLKRLGGAEYLCWLGREHPAEYLKLIAETMRSEPEAIGWICAKVQDGKVIGYEVVHNGEKN